MAKIIPVRSCQSGYRNRNIRTKQLPRAGCHILCCLGRNGAMLRQHRIRDTENPVFYLITVADDSTLIESTAARNGRQRRANSASRQTFGRDQGLPF